MFYIGEFSKMGKTTNKTLHHYDRIGLLHPEAVDGATGYRLYTTRQLAELHRIQSLRQAGLSVEEVAAIVAGGCYFLGGFGRLFSDQVDVAANGYDSIIPTMLSGLSDVLIAVVVILVLSASMSTLSSLVLASSSTLTLDVLKGRVIREDDEKSQVLVMRGLIVLFIAISVVLAIIQYRSSVTFIAQLMGVSWGALAGAFLAPFLYSLYWKKATRGACWVCFLFSTIFMLANIFVGDHFPTLLQSPINAGAFCMLSGLVIVPVVSLLTPKPDKNLVDAAFSCYDRKVLVRQRQALGERE